MTTEQMQEVLETSDRLVGEVCLYIDTPGMVIFVE